MLTCDWSIGGGRGLGALLQHRVRRRHHRRPRRGVRSVRQQIQPHLQPGLLMLLLLISVLNISSYSPEDSEQRPRQPQQPLLQPRRAPADPGRQPGRGAQHEALAQPQAATHKYFLGVINYFFANRRRDKKTTEALKEGNTKLFRQMEFSKLDDILAQVIPRDSR